MAGAVRIVRGDGQGIVLRAKLAIEAEGDPHRFAGGARSELHLLELGIRPVHIEPDAVANQDADHGIRDLLVELHRDPHLDGFAAAPDHGGLPVRAERLHLEDFGAAVAAAGLRRDRGWGSGLARLAQLPRDVLAVMIEHGAGLSAAHELSLVQPPELVAETAQQRLFMADEQDRRALAAAAAQRRDCSLTRESIVARQGVFEQEHVGGAEIELVVGSEIPAGLPRADRTGGRRNLSRGRLEQRPRAGSILSDQPDDGGIRRICGERLQWRQSHLFKSDGH